MSAKTGTATVAFEAVAAGSGLRISLRAPDAPAMLALEVRSSTVTRRAVVELARSSTTTPIHSRALAQYEAGRGKLRGGDAHGAVAELDIARRLAREAGDRSLSLRSALLASFVLVMNLAELAGAEERLAEEGEPPAIDGEGRVLFHYHRGLFARRRGDYRAALRALDLGARLSGELGLSLRPVIANLQAIVLLDLGRFDEAIALFTALQGDPVLAGNSCFSADVSQNLGWALLAGGRARERPDIEGIFRAARGAFQGGCKDEEKENNLLVNLALYFLERGELDGARAALREIRGKQRPDARLWKIMLEARAALAGGDLGGAEQGYLRLGEEAKSGGFDDLEWSAAVGLGKIFEARKKYSRAIEYYRGAEEILGRASVLVPVDRGRLFYFERRGEGLDRLAGALLRAGRSAEAFDARRQARRRALTSVALGALGERANYAAYRNARDALEGSLAGAWKETRAEAARQQAAREILKRRALDALDDVIAALPERARVGLSRGELARPRSRELFAGVFRGERGFELYARTSSSMRAEVASRAPDGAGLLAFVERELAAVDRVVVFTSEADLALHSAVWKGRLLGAAKEVVYALDVPGREGSEPAAHKAELPGQASELRGDGSELRAQSSELRGDGSESRAQGSELRAQGSESRAQGSELRVQGSESRAQGSELRAQGSESRAQSSDLRGQDSESRAQGSGLRGQGSESRVQGSELRGDGSELRAQGSELLAVVIADPRGDLAAARAEGEEVARLMEGSGVAVERMVGGRATLAGLAAAFERADLLHFAGHAETAGFEGWETALLLSDGHAEVGDIVTSRRVPRWVVLAGCETGAQRSARVAAGIGLAASFLLAGSELVVATTEEIPDRTARAWSKAFYRGGLGSLLGAYRRALEATPPEEARAFRVFVR